MEWMTDPQAWIALVTLTTLEIVLGVDNIIFISILVSKLPSEQQQTARLLGLGLAMLMRIVLLFSISWIASMSEPLITIGRSFSGRDLILMGGGLFLLAKATMEIHNKLEGEEHHADGRGRASFASVITQIILLDIVFSIDSVITAIGMANHLTIMIIAVVIAVGFMMLFSGPIGEFVHRHPTVKMLALAFLLLIGVALIADGFHQHIPRGYIYFAMGFSVFVEMLNLRARSTTQKPVELRQQFQ